MPVCEICNRTVVNAHRDDAVPDAKKLMHQHLVGDVLVVEKRNGVRVPVGNAIGRDPWWKFWRRRSMAMPSRWAASWCRGLLR